MKGCFSGIATATLCWAFLAKDAVADPPVNDLFANRIAVFGLPLRLVGDTSQATVESGEPTEIQPGWGRQLERSVWYSWTATKSGVVGIYFPLDRVRTLKVFVGDSWEAMTAVPLTLSPDLLAGFRSLPNLTDWTLRAEAGVTYQIAVYDAGSFTLDLMERPANDFFVDRQEIPAAGGEVFGTTVNATFEPGEPLGATKSVWYLWTPDFNGPVGAILFAQNGTNQIEAVTGDSITNLAGVGALQARGNVFLPLTAEAGRAYSFRVSGRPALQTFRVLIVKAALNDHFMNATPLSGFSMLIEGTTWSATVEPGEPFMENAIPSTSTAWWKWTAPTNGLLRIKAGSFLHRAPYRLFTGDTLSNLRLLGSRYGNAGDGYPDYYTVSRGKTFYLRVEDSPITRVEMDLFTRPANDNFANRATLEGLSVSTTGANHLATRQSREPVHGGFRAGHSVWWTWTAPLSGHVFVNSVGSDFQNVIAAYAGNSLRELRLRGDNRFAYWTSVLSFPVEAGHSYQIAVDGIVDYDEESGKPRVSWGSIELGLDFTTLKFNSPTNGAAFTGPTNITLSLHTPQEAVDGQIAAAEYYVPDNIYGAQPVGLAASAPFTFTTSLLTPGIHVYGAAVTNHLGQVRVVPPVVFGIRPPNDNFSDSIQLAAIPGLTKGWVSGGTWEAREKRPLRVAPTAGSSWWVWTAPETGPLRMRVNTGTALILYRGPALESLKAVTKFGYGETVFNAVAGETYHLQAYSPARTPAEVSADVEFILSR